MPMHFLDRVHRPASGPVAVGIVLEVSLEDGFDHNLGGSLNHSITNGRNAERTLATIRFGDHHAPHRIRSVRLRDQFRAQARHPSKLTWLRPPEDGRFETSDSEQN